MAIAAPIHLFDKTVTTQRATVTRDSGGSPISTWADQLTGIPARVQPMSGAQAVRYGRESNRNLWRVFVATGQDINKEDRLTFVDDTSGSNVSRTLNIEEIRNPQQAGVVMTIICEETE